MLSHSNSVLSNGLRLVTVEQPHLHSANVGLFVKAGSRHESCSTWGLAHLVEHMLFRGSRRFPDTTRLAQEFERGGGSLDGSTWRDHTSLTTSCHPSYLRRILVALGDMVCSPAFEGLDVERTVVEEEIQGNVDEVGQDTDVNNVSRALVWQDHPMGRRITGSFETLSAFDDTDLHRFHTEHYVASNAVLCVAGPVQASQVESLAEEAFADLPRGQQTPDGVAACFSPGSFLEVRPQRGSQLDVQLTFEALPIRAEEFAALGLLVRVLDDGISSRLQQAVCTRKGLVYELSTGLDCYADCGLYDVEMRVAPRRAASAIAATLETLEELCTAGVSPHELRLARERGLHEVEFAIDSAEDLASQYGTSTLFDAPEPLEVEAARLAAVEPGDVLRVARRVFDSGRLHATIMGPVERANMKRIAKLIGHFVRSTER